MSTITKFSVRDLRYPIGAGHGSDAIHRDPIYSYAALVITAARNSHLVSLGNSTPSTSTENTHPLRPNLAPANLYLSRSNGRWGHACHKYRVR